MQIPGVYNALEETEGKPKPTGAQREQFKKIHSALKPGSNLKVALDKTQVKIEKRENGKGMKITFKLNKEESEGFTNICNMSKPENVSTEQFVKFLVFRGMDSFQTELKERVEKFKQEHPEEFAKITAESVSSDEINMENLESTEDPKVDIIKD